MMIRLVSCCVLALLAATARAQAPATSDCAAPNTRDKVAACVATELRQADARINDLYRSVMARRDPTGRDALRVAQREWVATRDRDCVLKISAKERERWFDLVAADPRVAVCVTNHTRYRIAVLEALDAGRPPPTAEFLDKSQSTAAQMTTTLPDQNGKPRLPTRHSDGKWYFEVTIDRAAGAKAGIRSIMAGFQGVEDDQFLCTLHEIHPSDFGTIQIGLAIDLDNGMVYFREAGSWNGKEPGSNRGMAVKLGQEFFAAVRADRAAEMTSSGAVQPNFGDTPFQMPIPAGYRKWR